MKISFIQPSRNNLKYLKWSYEAIRKNLSHKEHEICVADDFSNDGTLEWCKEMSQKDPHFKFIRNDGPTRLGHTILYDRLINEVATNDVVMIYHADMYACPNFDKYVEKYITPGTIVSLTRIEPPLHPPGPEKIVQAFGTEPEEFNEAGFLKWFNDTRLTRKDKTTEGIFAPWALYKSDFQSIGGHDDLYAPQSKEDSDIFNRFLLNGYKFVQTWEGCVYHMTCRGSRFKDGIEIEAEIPLPDGTIWYKPKDSEEYKALRAIKFREWWRKWGSNVLHDEYLMPIVHPKYNIAFVVKHCNLQALELLEPWCDRIYIEDTMQVLTDSYIQKEQPNTKFDLSKRILTLEYNDPQGENDIVVEFDARNLSQQSFNIIQQLSEIVKASGEVGQFELDIFTITIHSMTEYQHDLIVCNN